MAGQAALHSPSWARALSPRFPTTPSEGPPSSKAVTFAEEPLFVRTVSSLTERQQQLGKVPHSPKAIHHSHLPHTARWTERHSNVRVDLPTEPLPNSLFARRLSKNPAEENSAAETNGHEDRWAPDLRRDEA
jgi:hypothetical protein